MFIHVFAVGKKELLLITNVIDGSSVNPRIGSSSLPVTNCRILCNVMLPLRPPAKLKKKNYKICSICLRCLWHLKISHIQYAYSEQDNWSARSPECNTNAKSGRVIEPSSFVFFYIYIYSIFIIRYIYIYLKSCHKILNKKH